MVATAEKKYTVEEYLELENTAEIRHEFVHGKLIPMPGESIIANIISLNLAILLRQILQGKGFTVVLHDVRLIIDETNIYRYPDVALAATASLENTHAITQPILLAEITSDKSAETDRGAKLLEYTQLPSLQHYLIISQSEYLVEVYSRREGEWRFTYCTDPADVLELTTPDMAIALKDLYEGISFPEKA